MKNEHSNTIWHMSIERGFVLESQPISVHHCAAVNLTIGTMNRYSNIQIRPTGLIQYIIRIIHMFHTLLCLVWGNFTRIHQVYFTSTQETYDYPNASEATLKYSKNPPTTIHITTSKTNNNRMVCIFYGMYGIYAHNTKMKLLLIFSKLIWVSWT